MGHDLVRTFVNSTSLCRWMKGSTISTVRVFRALKSSTRTQKPRNKSVPSRAPPIHRSLKTNLLQRRLDWPSDPSRRTGERRRSRRGSDGAFLCARHSWIISSCYLASSDLMLLLPDL
ncbi:hypothetical protein ACLOJK_013430 [Asimina triloba]